MINPKFEAKLRLKELALVEETIPTTTASRAIATISGQEVQFLSLPLSA